MRKPIVAAVIAISFFAISAFGQGKAAISANNHPNTKTPSSNSETSDTRSRIITGTPTTPSTAGKQAAQMWGNATVNLTERPRLAVGNPSAANVAAPESTSAALPTADSTTPTQTYRIGVGDILDIQIQDSVSARSTLYTVNEGGMLDYPLASGTLAVAGLTTDVIAARLRASIKVLNNPPVTVKVRDFASHAVNVIGFVRLPGTKVLRREAVPVYVIMSESMPLTEATTATVIRDGKTAFVVNLKDSNAVNQLVVAGDLIRVSGNTTAPVAAASAPEYYYAGGEVNAPGQKPFHTGLTLTQSIIASGGRSLNAGNTVRVSRQNSDGRLVTSEYNFSNIQNGKTPDPQIQKGDRIEVSRN